MTRPYAEVIGDPIAHSKSPIIHGFWLEKLGIDAEYRRCHVRPEELADYFTRRREDAKWRGCNITIPHKEAIARFIDEVGPGASKVGAVNTVWRQEGKLHGTNTDVDGVREALSGVDAVGRPVVIIGAGGAARSAFAYFEGLGCGEVRVLARSPAKADLALADFSLPARTHDFSGRDSVFDDAAIVVNATQLGMVGQEAMPRFVLDGLARTATDSLVFDMVYAPLQTELLTQAASTGRSTGHGLTMLIGQARTAFARFFGKSPPDTLDGELLKILTS